MMTIINILHMLRKSLKNMTVMNREAEYVKKN